MRRGWDDMVIDWFEVCSTTTVKAASCSSSYPEKLGSVPNVALRRSDPASVMT